MKTNQNTMELLYKTNEIELSFKESVNFYLPPSFAIRSILGLNLKAMSCLTKKSNCLDCLYVSSCVYGILFETPVNYFTHLQDSNIKIHQTEKLPHPIIIQVKNYIEKEKFITNKIYLNIILLNKFESFFPYIFQAIARAGENGILKERYKFNTELIETNIKDKQWELQNSNNLYDMNIKINFNTPIRIKKDGILQKTIQYKDLLDASYRRIEQLTVLYGSNTIINKKDFLQNITPKKQNITQNWRDDNHWSSRQKTNMQLGGCIGELGVEGKFSDVELSLLKAAKIFQIGKNTSFGLGRISVFTSIND